MEPEPGNPIEVEGTLNQTAVRGPDAKLNLFPRIVVKENYSRIGMARFRLRDSLPPEGVADSPTEKV